MRIVGWYLLLVPFLVSPGWADPPKVDLAETAVMVSGVTPGGRVALFGITRRSFEYIEQVERWEEILVDDDNDGAVTLEVAEPLPENAVWFAVDLTGGEFRAASPSTFPLREVALPEGVADSRSSFQDHRDYVEVFLARPGDGADAGVWGISAGDGGEGDDDGEQDRSLTTPLVKLLPLAGSPDPPEQWASGDVLVVVDPNQMEFYAVRLGGN